MSLSQNDIDTILGQIDFEAFTSWDPSAQPYFVGDDKIVQASDVFELPDAGWLMCWYWFAFEWAQEANYAENALPDHICYLYGAPNSALYHYWSGQSINNDPFLAAKLDPYGYCSGDYSLLGDRIPRGERKIGVSPNWDYEDAYVLPAPADKFTGEVQFPFPDGNAPNPDDASITWYYGYCSENEPAVIGHAGWKASYYYLILYRITAPALLPPPVLGMIASIAGLPNSLWTRRPPQ